MLDTILVPLDGSSLSERALPIATTLAHGLGAKLVLVRGASPAAGEDTIETEFLAVQEAEAYLAEVAGRLGEQGLEVETVTTDLEPCDGILLEARLHQADLIVMCTHGRSGRELWQHGSVAEDVLGYSEIPLLLVRPTDAADHAPLQGSTWLVPLDGSAFSESVLPAASTLAAALDATLLLVRVVERQLYDEPGDDEFFNTAQQVEEEQQGEAERYLAGLSARLAGSGVGGRLETRVRLGSAADMILDEAMASDAGLVAMATHERTGLGALIMGNVTRQVFERDTRPMLVVRPNGTAQ